MSRPVLVVTRPLPADVEARMAREYAVRRDAQGGFLAKGALLRAADGAAALLVTPAHRLDAAFFERLARSVRVIVTYSVGYEHIDLRAAAAKGVAIANTPGVLTDATADVAMLLLLGASRRVHEAETLLRSGAWAAGHPVDLLGWQLTGKVLGIYGMGRIGQAMARRARSFGMQIHYTNRTRLADAVAGDAVFHADAKDLLRVSAFLSLNATVTPETKHFLNSETIAVLPEGAVVVNTARGALVRDADLIAALKTGRVAAAGLDVYEGEPKIDPGYLALPNVFLLPHIGSATVETRSAMGMLALDNIDAVLAGRAAPSLLRG